METPFGWRSQKIEITGLASQKTSSTSLWDDEDSAIEGEQLYLLTVEPVTVHVGVLV